MTPSTFVKRTTVDTVAVLVIVAAGVGWVGGTSAALGVLAGGALATANLWWLARRAVVATESPASTWSVVAVVRLAVVGLGVGVVLASGVAHPLGVVAGLTVLPFVLVARGLVAAREA